MRLRPAKLSYLKCVFERCASMCMGGYCRCSVTLRMALSGSALLNKICDKVQWYTKLELMTQNGGIRVNFSSHNIYNFMLQCKECNCAHKLAVQSSGCEDQHRCRFRGVDEHDIESNGKLRSMIALKRWPCFFLSFCYANHLQFKKASITFWRSSNN